jgi:hypothetical protein
MVSVARSSAARGGWAPETWVRRWRGGRVVDRAGLENRSGCKPTVGSNPTLSASFPVFFNSLDDFQPEGRSTEGEPIRWDKVESIRHLRHHPKTGVLQYRRVVPPDLRSILGRGSICASLGSKVLDHAALIRWVEIDRDARRRLDDARQKLCAASTDQGAGQNPPPQFIDIRACAAAFQVWSEREVGRESARVYGVAAHGFDDSGLLLPASSAFLLCRSLNAETSNIGSARRFFRRQFSSSGAFSFGASDTPMPPYVEFHR